MSDGEGHSDNLELSGSSNLVHNKEPGKIRGGGKRMEEKEKKPKRHYKKRAPKPALASIPAEEGGEAAGTATATGKANRNRVSKRNNESSKKRTRTPSKPPIIEAELLNPSGGPSKILQLDPHKFIPLNRIFPPGVPFPPCAACNNDDIYSWDEESRMRRLRNMCPPVDDDDDMDTDSDSDTEECTLSDIGEILKEILVEFRKHDPTDKDN